MKRSRGPGKRRSPAQRVRARLDEAEATLEAIRKGEVDALVVSGPGGERTLAIEGATHPYHVLLDAMSDGAALLDRNGTILFVNRRLREIAGVRAGVLGGSRFQLLVAAPERPGFEAFLRESAARKGARDFAMAGRAAAATPVRIALSAVPLGDYPGPSGAAAPNGVVVLMAVVTDLTDRKRAEAGRLELMKRLISAEDDERRRIARELHDETGQSLTALLVGLRALEEQAVTRDVASIAERLRGVASQTVDDVGRLARGLHPAVLDDLGLAAAVRRHVGDRARTFGWSVELRLESVVSLRFPPLVQTTLYRILQEALTNVGRHAAAQAVGVELKLEGGTLELVVRDDGLGFDPATARTDVLGFGLHGIAERVALLGGSVEIDSRPGRGTVVRALVPAEVPSPPTPPRRSGSRPRRKRTR